MPILFADVDLTSPVSILFAGIIVVGAGIVVLWRVSRTDKDAQLAAKDAELANARERERTHIEERAKWVEINLRVAKAMEGMDLRLAALERREAVRP